MTTTRKFNAHTLLGDIADGDVLLAERTNGVTARVTYTASTGSGLTDGDKGDITVTASGATWTIDNGVITLAKQADMATASLFYRKTAGSGAPEINTLATLKTDLGLTGTNSGDQTITLTGDVTGSGTGSFAATIANDAVSYAKMQNVSATDKILGRFSALAGDVEEIACTAAGRALLDDADVSAQRTTLGLGTLATQSGTFSGTSSGTNTGDQTSIVGITGTKAEFNTAVTDGNILYVGDVTQYTDEMAQDATGAMVGTSIVYNDGSATLQRAALTGDVTASQDSNATLIATPSSVTLATDDKILLKDTSASNVMGYATAQAIRDLAPGSGTLTSAQLATALTNETGSGLVVFNQSPALLQPTADNFINGYTSTATAAGTTTLTVTSNQTQIFTGSTTQTCVLPVVSTLVLGTTYFITNLSSDLVTVQSSGANSIQAMAANSTLILRSNATTGTGASVWYVVGYFAAASDLTGSGSMVRATSPTFVTGITSPKITFNSTSGIIGTTTNDTPAAGSVGEVISSYFSAGTALTNNVAKDVTSISLTAGHWYIYGWVLVVPSVALTLTTAWTSSTSATLPSAPHYGEFSLNTAALTYCTVPAPFEQQQLSGTTTIYLGTQTQFASGTCNAYGVLVGTRIR